MPWSPCAMLFNMCWPAPRNKTLKYWEAAASTTLCAGNLSCCELTSIQSQSSFCFHKCAMPLAISERFTPWLMLELVLRSLVMTVILSHDGRTGTIAPRCKEPTCHGYRTCTRSDRQRRYNSACARRRRSWVFRRSRIGGAVNCNTVRRIDRCNHFQPASNRFSHFA